MGTSLVPIFWIVLVAVLVDFFVGILSTILNIRKLKPNAPAGLEDIYEEDEYRKSQEYTRATSRFGLMSGFIGVLAFFIFWFAGGFNFIDQSIRGFGWNEIVVGAACWVIALRWVKALPLKTVASTPQEGE